MIIVLPSAASLIRSAQTALKRHHIEDKAQKVGPDSWVYVTGWGQQQVIKATLHSEINDDTGKPVGL